MRGLQALRALCLLRAKAPSAIPVGVIDKHTYNPQRIILGE